MIRKFFITVSVFVFLLTSAVDAQIKIGFMNTQEVLNQLPERDQIQKELEEFIAQKEQQLRARATAYQDSVTRYQDQKPSLNQEQEDKWEQKLAVMEAELGELEQSYQMEIQRKRSELLQPLFERMNRAIEVIAQKRGLDFVINEATGMGENIIFYASNETMDISDEVLNQILSESTQNQR